MSADIFAGKSKAEIAAIIEAGKAALKAGVQPSHPLVKDIVELIHDIVKQEGVTAEKVLAAVKVALGGKTTSTGTTRAMNRDRAIRAIFREELKTPLPKGKYPEAEKAFIEKFGQADFDARIAQFPIPNTK